jgi:hypothetical protein
MYFILFLTYAVQVVSKSIKFYTITDNDRQTEYSYLTYNELIDDREIKILKNVSVKPNELSSLKYIDDTLFTTDDKTGLLYQIKDYMIETYDKYNNFSKSETAYMKGKHLYIYNYTKFKRNVSKPRDLRYNLVKYNMKRKEISYVYDLTYLFNQYLKNQGYIYIDINAMDYDETSNNLYFAPRSYRNQKEKKIYKNDILILSNGKINKIRISEKLPKKYGITDMDIYNDKIFFVASKEIKLNDGKKDLKSIIFVTNMKGKLKTKFIKYDNKYKYEGIAVKR